MSLVSSLGKYASGAFKSASKWGVRNPAVAKATAVGTLAAVAFLGVKKVAKSLTNRSTAKMQMQPSTVSGRILPISEERIVKVEKGLKAASRALVLMQTSVGEPDCKAYSDMKTLKREFEKALEIDTVPTSSKTVEDSSDQDTDLSPKQRLTALMECNKEVAESLNELLLQDKEEKEHLLKLEAQQLKSELETAVKGSGRKLKPEDHVHLERAIIAAKKVKHFIGYRALFTDKYEPPTEQHEKAALAALHNQIAIMEFALGTGTGVVVGTESFKEAQMLTDQVDLGIRLAFANVNARIRTLEKQLDQGLRTGKFSDIETGDQAVIKHVIFATKQLLAYQQSQKASSKVIRGLKARIQRLEKHFGAVIEPKAIFGDIAHGVRTLATLGEKVDDFIYGKKLSQEIAKAEQQVGFRHIQERDKPYVYKAMLATENLESQVDPKDEEQQAFIAQYRHCKKMFKACLGNFKGEGFSLDASYDTAELVKMHKTGSQLVELHKKALEQGLKQKEQALAQTTDQLNRLNKAWIGKLFAGVKASREMRKALLVSIAQLQREVDKRKEVLSSYI